MEVEQYLFKQPTTFIISGATQSGKSTFVQNLLINKKKYLTIRQTQHTCFTKFGSQYIQKWQEWVLLQNLFATSPQKKICMTCYSIIKMMADQLLYLTTWVLKLKNILSYSTNYLLF